ncbi:ribonuclease P protein component [Macromonas nakdongensis]|uniref:ribonuclease P protein component n=1 Tax=Macromonas nakdongensis TaxID=1843082 RepID=UPI000C34823C|nr:ribonuclease P protein component [Macromonas nakdongensis]
MDANAPATSAGAPRWQRLRQRAQFEAVLASAPAAKTMHFALHAASMSALGDGRRALFAGAGPWLGVLIPKRWAKRAVTRNAIRRQIYAVAESCATTWPDQAVVVRLRSGFARQQFPSATSDALKQAVRAELLRLLPGGRRA